MYFANNEYIYSLNNIIMKQFPFVLLILSAALITGCSQQKEMKVLAEKIQYDVFVKNADPDLAWWVDNLEGSRRDPFLKDLFDKVYAGELQAYDYFNEPLSPDDVKAIGNDTVYSTLMRSYPPYEEYDTMVVMTITYLDVTKVRFLEQWEYDETSLEISKKIVGFAPVLVRNYGTETYNQVLFWVYPGGSPEGEK